MTLWRLWQWRGDCVAIAWRGNCVAMAWQWRGDNDDGDDYGAYALALKRNNDDCDDDCDNDDGNDCGDGNDDDDNDGDNGNW